jgi:hypothetical protein
MFDFEHQDTSLNDQAAHSAADGDAPHDCEFCSPEPEPIPAPWDEPTVRSLGSQVDARRLDLWYPAPEVIGAA